MFSRNAALVIADDAEDTRDLYAEFFGSRGLRAITARDGEEAVTLAISLRPDVIVMDLTGALEAGAAGCLTNPCLPDDLEAAVRRVLDGAA